MATKAPVKHGTRAGYDAELLTNSVCDRCRAAKRVYQRQYTKAGRAQGIKYSNHEVIDHLDKATRHATNIGSFKPRQSQAKPSAQAEPLAFTLTAEPNQGTGTAEPGPDTPSESRTRQSLADRMASAIGSFQSRSNEYVEDTEIPEYLHSIEPDADPAGGEWAEVRDEQIIITAKDRELIEENLGTYLSVIGMTLEVVDPYCGPILAENLEEIVKRWTKVIARYPRAAHLFMSTGGGMIMEWIGAIQATWPVLYAIYEHHLSKTIQTDNGKIYRVRTSANGHPVDATMPPANYDYTVN